MRHATHTHIYYTTLIHSHPLTHTHRHIPCIRVREGHVCGHAHGGSVFPQSVDHQSRRVDFICKIFQQIRELRRGREGERESERKRERKSERESERERERERENH